MALEANQVSFSCPYCHEMNQIIGLGEDDGYGDENIVNLCGDDDSTGECQRMTAMDETLYFAERCDIFFLFFCDAI